MILPETTTSNFLAVGVTLLAAYVIKQVLVPNSKKFKLPPGPRRLPFVGTLLSHGFCPDEFSKLSVTHGDFFTFYVGGHCCMVISSYELIREALVDHGLEFAHRGKGWMVQKANPNQDGIAIADYTEPKRRLRSESLSILRTLGVGRQVTEDKIMFEATELVRVIAEQNGRTDFRQLSSQS